MENLTLGQRLQKLEIMVERLLRAANLSPEVDLPPEPDMPTDLNPHPWAIPEYYKNLGLIGSETMTERADEFFETTGYTAPEFFLPDLDGFNSKFRTYRSVIDEADLNNQQKASYWFTMRASSLMAVFLGKRREYSVEAVVPAGQGKGREEYGFQFAGYKLEDVRLVPNVKTVEAAEKWQKEWIDNFYRMNGYLERAK